MHCCEKNKGVSRASRFKDSKCVSKSSTKPLRGLSELLEKKIQQSDGSIVEGVILLFKLSFNRRKSDIDNYCDPVFSVLTSKLKWFYANKNKIKWWIASKTYDYTEGLIIELEPSSSPTLEICDGQCVFRSVYNGILPSSATDPEIPNWIKQLGKARTSNNSDRFNMQIQFGSDINIGDIASVKHIIDCLYPIIGGIEGDPEDWRIDRLVVEKSIRDLGINEVQIGIWLTSGGDSA